MGLAKTPPGDGERTHLRFAFLSQAKYHFKMSKIVFFRIRRLRLEDGGQFHNNILIKEHEFLKKKNVSEIGGIMIVVGGMCRGSKDGCQEDLRTIEQGDGSSVSDEPIPLFYWKEIKFLWLHNSFWRQLHLRGGMERESTVSDAHTDCAAGDDDHDRCQCWWECSTLLYPVSLSSG